MKKQKTYKRFIKCSQKITYYQEVELTKDELELLENANDCNICQYTGNDIDRQAYELVESFFSILGGIEPKDWYFFHKEQAKKCALICYKEVFDELIPYSEDMNFWIEVKKEIELL